MRKRSRLASVAFLASVLFPGVAAHAQTLSDTIRFIEYPNGSVPAAGSNTAGIAVPFDSGVHGVGMNSIIVVKVNAPDREVKAAKDVLCRDASSDDCHLAQAAEELRGAGDALREAYQGAAAIVRIGSVTHGEVTDEMLKVKRSANTAFTAFTTHYRQYSSILASSPSSDLRIHAADFDARVKAMLRTSTEGGSASERLEQRRQTMPGIFYDEAGWLVRKIAERQQALLTQPGSRVLVLATQARTKDGLVELSLPNYNTVPPGTPSVFQQVRWVPTDEQIAEAKALFKEATSTADTFNQLAEDHKKLREAVQQFLDANGIDLAQLRASLKAAEDSVTALRAAGWPKLRSDLTAAVDKALQQASLTSDQKQQLTKIKTDFATVSNAITGADQAAKNIIDKADALRKVIDDLPSQTDAVDALVSLLRASSGAFDIATGRAKEFAGLKTAAQDLVAALQSAPATLQNIQSLAQQLAPALTDSVISNLLDTAETALKPAFDALQTLKTTADNVVKLVKTLANLSPNTPVDVRDQPPPTSFDVSLLKAPDTSIRIQGITPRNPGDTVTFQAWLYELSDPNDLTKKKQVETVAETFRLQEFGFFTAANVGVAYVIAIEKPEGQTTKPRTFAPQVTWQLKYRPRTHPIFGSTGIGLHTATFDLDKDNQLELGLGVTVTFLDDFLYFGVGHDLTVSNRNYWFVGTRLFQFAQRIVGTTQSTTP